MAADTAAQKPKKTRQEVFEDFIRTQDEARDALAALSMAKTRAEYDRLQWIRMDKDRAYRHAMTAYLIDMRSRLPEDNLSDK